MRGETFETQESGGWALAKTREITSKGRITVRLAIRRVLGVSEGDVLLFEEEKLVRNLKK